MRIVIDMQGAQSMGSRDRGIGRYTMSLAQAIARNRGEHEVILALNGLFPDTIEPIRAAFDGMLPQDNIRVWYAAGPVADLNANNDWRQQCAECLREAFLASLKPDMVHVSSLFEGLGDDAVTSIGTLGHLPTAVTLYDLIPYIHRRPYLENPAVERWYLCKLDHLRRANLWLAISESSRQEGIDYLNLPKFQAINVSTAADPHFQPLEITPQAEQNLRQRYGLQHPFVMYTGGIDHRKNVEGLIRAFARLPAPIRRQHQLAIVCAARNEDRHRLWQLAKKQGLSPADVVLTGFVPEDDLVGLYNLCTLFVFPSWHEGFGLPALEAMRCDAPVIGANTSSIPEVIGWDQALFDPHSDEAIAAAIERGLTEDTFRSELIRRGRRQAEKFSWDASAQRAIAAFERFHAERGGKASILARPSRRPRLAYVSPLPPARSGIADYSAELLPELARHYQIELIVAQDEVSDTQAGACWPIRPVAWLVEHASRYDRVLYHFGNSTFHQHMFELLRMIPGVVVLHDFFLSSILAHMEMLGIQPNAWVEALYHSHGYGAVRERLCARDLEPVVWKYPCNLNVLQRALGIIVHSAYSRDLAGKWYGVIQETDWTVIPLMRQPQPNADRGKAKAALGFTDDDFIVCSFGMLGPIKLNHRLLDAWLASRLSGHNNCHLVFVGENHGGGYGQKLLTRIRNSKASKRIRITGWADADTFRHFLAAADVAVQLRTLSRGETSAAVLDCMNYGLATIVNANGSMAELPDEAVRKLPDEFSDEQLIEALESLRQEGDKRRLLGRNAQDRIRREHNPRRCGDEYAAAIERFYAAAGFGWNALSSSIAAITSSADNAELISLADFMGQSIAPRVVSRQLLVDVSELVQRDAKSGIQRVVRSILYELLMNPPASFRVEPVYATLEQGYRYARRFTMDFQGCPSSPLVDEPIEAHPGDIFLGLDLQPHVVSAHRESYQRLRQRGIEVWFVVYDLLCVLMPQHFIDGIAEGHTRWLGVVAESDGALCISKSVADEFAAWIEANGPKHERRFKIDWFHLGADIENSHPTKGLPPDAAEVLEALTKNPTFSMIGTLEPRKGHVQTLAAFEQLWAQGIDINLVIVGKQGWLVEALVEKLRAHPERGRRLFWLEGISDEYLEKVYSASTCLIAASYGEGFGLPLIEAAQHRLPIIARDIPVFREVAGEHAFYFSDDKAPETLVHAVREWLSLYARDAHPKSGGMPWLTWKESAGQLLDAVLGKRRPTHEWLADGTLRLGDPGLVPESAKWLRQSGKSAARWG